MKSQAGQTLRKNLLCACAAFALMGTPAAFADMPTVEATQAAIASNPLFMAWDTPYGAPPFESFEPSHFIPAFEHAMALHNAEIAAITSNPMAPTFNNTIGALERSGMDLARVGSTFGALTSSATNDALRDIQSAMSPRRAAHSSAIALSVVI